MLSNGNTVGDAPMPIYDNDTSYTAPLSDLVEATRQYLDSELQDTITFLNGTVLAAATPAPSPDMSGITIT